jgi:hypothetical protein
MVFKGGLDYNAEIVMGNDSKIYPKYLLCFLGMLISK